MKDYMHSFTIDIIGLMKGAEISKDKVSGKKRLQMLHTAESIMVKHITEPISIQDIASQLNVSERTLLYAFKKRFDMGPKVFMKILRLNHVHHLLNQDNGKDSISAIARESGFWHMGQFHVDFKSFFGELPSETIRNSKEQSKNTH